VNAFFVNVTQIKTKFNYAIKTNLDREFQSHTKILHQYLNIALTVVATVHVGSNDYIS
jgi:hypothetical protein